MGTSICHSVISQMINFLVVCCFVNPGSDPSSDPGFILSLSHLVLTTNNDLVNNVMVGEPFSDHNAITFAINSAPYTSRISKKYTYAFNKADWSHLKSLFKHSPWDLVLAGEDINNIIMSYENFIQARQKKSSVPPVKCKVKMRGLL